MTDRYGVMGYPIAHSRSPFIHARFAAATGQDLTYEAMLVEPGTFPRSVETFFGTGGKGLNVTVPFKGEAWALARRRTDRAERAGAVNTLWVPVDGGEGAPVHGDNTDGVGLLRDLVDNHGIDPRGRRVLLLGAGGAARGVMAPLLERSPGRLVVANRTPERAGELCAAFADLGPAEPRGLDALAGERFDLVVSATSAGLQGARLELPADVLEPSAACYDMAYGPSAEPFLDWARAHGAGPCLDGVGMLVEQAAESFSRWRGVRPETRPVIEALSAALAGEK